MIERRKREEGMMIEAAEGAADGLEGVEGGVIVIGATGVALQW